MACAATASWSGDFPAWLEAQGVNVEVAQAMDSELGIRDFGVLRACVGDGLVRAELLATARDRLPFGFYAVLRQVVKALQGAETQEGRTTMQTEASTLRVDLVLSSLVDVLVALFGGLSRELSMSMEKLGSMDVSAFVGGSSPAGSSGGSKYRPPEGDDLTARLSNNYSNHNNATEFTNAEDEASSAVEEFEERDFNGESAGEVAEASLDGMAAARLVESGVGVTAHRSWYGVKMEACEDERSTVAASATLLPSRRGVEGSGRRPSWGEPGPGRDTGPVSPVKPVGGKGRGFSLTRGEVPLEFATGDGSNRASWQEPEDPGAVATTSAQHRGDASLEFATGGDGSNRASWQEPQDPGAVATTSAQHSGNGSMRKLGLTILGVESLSTNPMQLPAPPQPALQSQHRQAEGDETGPDRVTECSECGRVFSNSAHLTAHMRSHTGEKPYGCDVCGRAFSLKGNLKTHRLTHTGEKPYRCTVCERAFTHYSSLKYHRQTHTGEKPYSCDLCGRSFSQGSSLKAHRFMHTGEKPYTCHVCGRAFSQCRSLKTHLCKPEGF